MVQLLLKQLGSRERGKTFLEQRPFSWLSRIATASPKAGVPSFPSSSACREPAGGPWVGGGNLKSSGIAETAVDKNSWLNKWLCFSKATLSVLWGARRGVGGRLLPLPEMPWGQLPCPCYPQPPKLDIPQIQTSEVEMGGCPITSPNLPGEMPPPGDVCLAARWVSGGCRAPVGGCRLCHGAVWRWDPAGKQADKAAGQELSPCQKTPTSGITPPASQFFLFRYTQRLGCLNEAVKRFNN